MRINQLWKRRKGVPVLHGRAYKNLHAPFNTFFLLPFNPELLGDRLRDQIIRRDRYCKTCGSKPKWVCYKNRRNVIMSNGWQAEMDHRIPRKYGGATDETNLQLMCTACNRRKGDQMPGKVYFPKERR